MMLPKKKERKKKNVRKEFEIIELLYPFGNSVKWGI